MFAAPYIVNDCVDQLEYYNTSRENSDLKAIECDGHSIVYNILLTLSTSFANDNGSFATVDKLQKLVPAIVDQVFFNLVIF